MCLRTRKRLFITSQHTLKGKRTGGPCSCALKAPWKDRPNWVRVFWDIQENRLKVAPGLCAKGTNASGQRLSSSCPNLSRTPSKGKENSLQTKSLSPPSINSHAPNFQPCFHPKSLHRDSVSNQLNCSRRSSVVQTIPSHTEHRMKNLVFMWAHTVICLCQVASQFSYF